MKGVVITAQAGRITGSTNYLLRFAALGGDVHISVNVGDLNRTSSIATELLSVSERPVRDVEDVSPALLGGR